MDCKKNVMFMLSSQLPAIDWDPNVAAPQATPIISGACDDSLP